MLELPHRTRHGGFCVFPIKEGIVEMGTRKLGREVNQAIIMRFRTQYLKISVFIICIDKYNTQGMD